MQQRLLVLDVARGLAAMVVVFWHWQHFFFINNRISPDFDKSKQPFYTELSAIYNHGGHVAVLFFFSLSGYIFYWLYSDSIKNRNCSAWDFFVLRFARLYPLFLASLLIVSLLQVVHFWKTGFTFVYENNDVRHFLLNLFMVPFWGFENGFSFNGPAWSISVEVGLYVVFFTLTALGFRGWVSLLAFFLGIALLERFGLDRRWSIPLECFFAGGLAYHAMRFYLTCKARSSMIDFLVISSAVLIWLVLIFGGSGTYAQFDHHRLYARLLFPFTIMALVVAEKYLGSKLAPFHWVGDISYSSYLIHFPLQIIFVLIVLMFGLDRNVFYSPVTLIVFFLVLLPASYFVFIGFERPLQKAIRMKLLSQNSMETKKHA